MEDEKIIALFFARDEAAIQETACMYSTKLHRLAVRITQDEQDAAEILNDTYLRAWNTIPPNLPDSFFAYLAKICRNLCFDRLDHKKAKKRKADLTVLTREMEACIPGANRILSGIRMQAGVEDEVEARMQAERLGRLLNRFLDGICAESRMIFMRRYWYADSVREIAQRYGISESKVKTCLHRTRKALRKYLESEGIHV
ncbi:MAG: RNA polymerase sigma factor [Eubacterium sp.]|nr:RNA polymerase sigma factor [Eubacterium sp.]